MLDLRPVSAWFPRGSCCGPLLGFACSLALGVALAAGPSAAVTIDFDALAPGTPVATLGDVTFSVDPDVGLEVGTGLATTSGANYLASADGDGSFLSGDVITLEFAVPVRSLSLAVVSTMGTAPGAFTLFSDAGMATSGAPDAFLGMDEVFLLSIEPSAPIARAELRASAGGLFAFNPDDVTYAVPEPGVALMLTALLVPLLGFGRCARCVRSSPPRLERTSAMTPPLRLLVRAGSTALFLLLLPDGALAQRSVPVTVVNQPDVQATLNVNEPAFQPVMLQNSRSTTPSGMNVSLFTGVGVDPVPAGKRMVVQHLSYSISNAAMVGDPDCRTRVGFAPETKVHPLPIRRSFLGSGTELGVISIPFTIYLDEGEELEIVCGVRVTGTVFQRIGVTGYYVDLE